MATEEAFIPEQNQELSAEKEKMENETTPNNAESNKAKIPDSGNGCQMMEHEGVTRPVIDEKPAVPDSEVSVEPLPPHAEETSAEIENEDGKTDEDTVEESVTSSDEHKEDSEESITTPDAHKEDSEEFVDAVNALPETDGVAENEVIEYVLEKEEAFVCGAEQTDEHNVATPIASEKSEESESQDGQSDEENGLEAVEDEDESKNVECPDNYDSENFAEGDVEVSETLCDGPKETLEESVEMESPHTNENPVPDETCEENINEGENLICEKLENMKVEEESDYKQGGDEAPVTETTEAARNPEQAMKGTEIPEQDLETVDSLEDATE